MRIRTVPGTALIIGMAIAFLIGMSPTELRAQDDEGDSAPPESVEQAEAEAEGEGGEDADEVEAEVEEEEQIEIDPEIFDDALEDFYARRYADAAAGFYGYINFGDTSAENYEWAQFFLAECLRGLEFWHAAVQYYYIVAKTRQRPEILPDAMRRLEEISRARPYSEPLILEDLIYDSEFGLLPPDMDRWISFVQGLYDFRNEFIRWGEAHFDQIKVDSYYGVRARYVEAVYALKKREDDRGLALLELVVESPVDAPDIKNKGYLALARLLFDLERYKDALEMYEQVQQIELSYEQATLLLEKAWAYYHLSDYRKAMGLLHALNAPSYQKYFLPDAFILRGLILKELCHFIPAKRVVRAFRYTYQRSLDDLRRRIPMEDIQRVFDGATQEGPISRRTALLRTLEGERRRIEDYDSVWEDVGLDTHLRRIYDLEIREQARLWRIDFDRAADEAAERLLWAEEQINLLDYEVGLDIFKRLKLNAARKTREEKLIVPYDSANVYYEFDTEYWNDELHSYNYFVSSRCFETSEEE